MDDVIESAEVAPIEDAAPTLAEHRAEFPTPTGRRQPPIDPSAPVDAIEDVPPIAAKPPQEKTRHRAKSQQMRAEDVPRLKEAHRQRMEAEDKAAKLEARLAALEAPKPAVEPKIEPVQAVTKPVESAAPSRPDPNDLAKYPYGSADPAFIQDTADWTYDTRTAAREAKQREERESAAAEEQKTAGRKAFTERWQAEAKADPSFEEIAKRPTLWPVGTGHPIDLWIWTRQAGVKVLRYLNDPANIAETQRIMALPTPDDQVVALALLEQRFHTPPLDEKTGAPAAVKLEPSLRPPTPVRTGPMRPSDTPPPEGSSLREHQRYYPQTRRR